MGAADPATLIGQTFVFSRLSPEELARLAPAFSVGRFEPGETVVRQGDPIHAWHVVESGRARVTDQSTAGPSATLLLGPGDTFGDRGLIAQEKWTSSIRADTPLTVLTMTRAAFERFVREVVPDRRDEFTRRIAQSHDFAVGAA